MLTCFYYLYPDVWEHPLRGYFNSCPCPLLSPHTHKLTTSLWVLPLWPSGQWTCRLPARPWQKTNLSALISVGGSPLKALLQDWRSPISTISFWQAAKGVTWDQLCTDDTWQAHRAVMVAGRTGKQTKQIVPCTCIGQWQNKHFWGERLVQRVAEK